jgi:hypothetical protein
MKDALVSNLAARGAVAIGIAILAGVSGLVFDYHYWRWIFVVAAVVLFGVYRSWRIGLAFISFAVIWAGLVVILTPIFFGYRLDEVIFMKRLWTGDIAWPYGVAVSGLLSAAWGAIAGDLALESISRRGAPFSTETVAPEHVIHFPADSERN